MIDLLVFQGKALKSFKTFTFLFSPGMEAVLARCCCGGFCPETFDLFTAVVLLSNAFRLKIFGDLLRAIDDDDVEYMSRFSSLIWEIENKIKMNPTCENYKFSYHVPLHAITGDRN